MAWTPAPRPFRAPNGAPVTRIVARADAPRTPTAELAGAWRELRDTPADTADRYRAAQIGGPTDRMRLEIRINGGSAQTLDAAGIPVGGTVGVEQPVEIRPVTLDSVDTDCPTCTWTVWVSRAGTAASWQESA